MNMVIYKLTTCTCQCSSTHRPITLTGKPHDFTTKVDSAMSLKCSPSLTGLAAQS